MIEGQKVILAKPQTYMNLSGESVRSLLDYYKVDEEQELLVIYDDISLGAVSYTHLILLWKPGTFFGEDRLCF